MKCDQARQALLPEPGRHLVSAEADRAVEHYQTCDGCQRFFRVSGLLSTRMRSIGARRPCPAPVADRTRKLIRREAATEAAAGRRRLFLFSGGGLLAAAAALLLLVGQTEMPSEAVGSLVTEARAALGGNDAIQSSDRAEVERWLSRRAGFVVTLPEIAEGTLQGGRVVRLGEAPAAAAVYSYHGQAITYFALSSGSVMGTPLSERGVVSASSDGYEVALWTESGRARALAAAMPRADVMSVAKECRRKAGMQTQT